MDPVAPRPLAVNFCGSAINFGTVHAHPRSSVFTISLSLYLACGRRLLSSRLVVLEEHEILQQQKQQASPSLRASVHITSHPRANQTPTPNSLPLLRRVPVSPHVPLLGSVDLTFELPSQNHS